MLRRSFVITGVSALAALGQQKKEEPKADIVAGATQDPTPRVGIVLSSFKEGEDHDGTKIPGLASPQPATAELSDAQFEAMALKAIEVGGMKSAEFWETVEPEGWVLILTRPQADPRLALATLNSIASHKRGVRFTVASRLAKAGNWNQAYTKIIGDMSAKYPKLRFELVDLNTAPTVELPVNGKPGVTNSIPKVLQQCDTLISISPLATGAEHGVALSIANYATLVTKPVTTSEGLMDLFDYRPSDLALVGGSLGTQGDGTSVHHNVVVAGMKAVAVDSIAASIMGFKPAGLKFLELGQKQGFGAWDPDEIWMRGSDIEAAKKEFKKPAGWPKA